MSYIKILNILLSFLLINTCYSMMDSDLIQTNYNKDNLDSSKTIEVYNLLELRKKAFQASSGQYMAINDKDKVLFNMIKNQTSSDAAGSQTSSCNAVKQISLGTSSTQIKPCMIKYVLNNNKNSMVPMSNIHSIRTSSNNNNTRNRNVKNINKTYIYV